MTTPSFTANVLMFSGDLVNDVCNGDRECPGCDEPIERDHVCDCGAVTGLVLASIERVAPTRVAVTMTVDVETIRSGLLPFGEVRLHVVSKGRPT